jgi:endonuclease/exonuclease/phosphatase family metal-dependent hydrolase
VRDGETVDRLLTALDGIGLPHAASGGATNNFASGGRPKGYVCLIATRWPLDPVSWPTGTTWPQLIAAARLEAPAGRVLVVNAHIPNGTGNGWEKVYALEALASGLAALDEPTILMGDFNEPKTFAPHLVSFRVDRHGGFQGVFKDRFGISHKRQRWQDAVTSVLEAAEHEGRWGGRLATAQLGVDNEPTHVVKKGAHRYFDHVLTSPPWVARTLVYDHSVRTGDAPISDHSLLAAGLAITDRQPESEQTSR